MERFLIVDDRDGRVLVALDDPDQALETFERMQEENPERSDALCLLKFDRVAGVIGTETAWRVRTPS